MINYSTSYHVKKCRNYKYDSEYNCSTVLLFLIDNLEYVSLTTISVLEIIYAFLRRIFGVK